MEQGCTSICLRELVTREAQLALGCSEPGMVALAAAYAAELADEDPVEIRVSVSPAVFKNGQAVGLPNTDLVGIDAAAALGAVTRAPERGLMVLSDIAEAQLELARTLLESGKVTVNTDATKHTLYAEVWVKTPNHSANAQMLGCHSCVQSATLDGERLEIHPQTTEQKPSNLLGECRFAEVVEKALALDLRELEFIEHGARGNFELARKTLSEGAKEAIPGMASALEKSLNELGVGLGATVRLLTAAAVSARMGGTDWPVLTCAGSGNQGLLASIPLCAVWDHWETEKRELEPDRSLLRALLVAHSVNLYLKSFTGEISALCGAVTGGAGVAAALCWLGGGDTHAMGRAVSSVIGGLCGMLCDGAKASCGFKIATAASEAMVAGLLALAGSGIDRENGIVSVSVEETARRLGSLTKKVLNLADEFLVKAV